MKQKQLNFINECRNLVGTKFVLNGRSEFGIDCAGLIVVAAEKIGMPLKDERYLPKSDYKKILFPLLKTNLIRINELELGCIVVIVSNNWTAHLAVYCGDTVIHADDSVRKVVEHSVTDAFINKIHSIWRLNWQNMQYPQQ